MQQARRNQMDDLVQQIEENLALVIFTCWQLQLYSIQQEKVTKYVYELVMRLSV